MKNQAVSGSAPKLQEWANFFSLLNGNKDVDKPLLKSAESPARIIMNLEREFSRIHQQPVFRRLGKHKQLSLNFS
jgi:hypothetical protein